MASSAESTGEPGDDQPGNTSDGNASNAAPLDPYALLAPWYDLEHDAFTEDLEAYQTLLAEYLGGQGTILEVGSGSGRLLAGLAVLGYRVTGTEPSLAMRDLAARRVAALPERVGRRISLADGDATAPHLPPNARFDAALIGLNTLAHLLTRAERQTSFATLARCLSPGGLLLLDLDLRGPRAMARALGQDWPQGTWPLPMGGELRHWATAQSVEGDTLTLEHRYEVWPSATNDANEASAPSQRVSVPMRLALLDPTEVVADLQAAGYTLDAHYGDYDLRRATARSPRALLVARKA